MSHFNTGTAISMVLHFLCISSRAHSFDTRHYSDYVSGFHNLLNVHSARAERVCRPSNRTPKGSKFAAFRCTDNLVPVAWLDHYYIQFVVIGRNQCIEIGPESVLTGRSTVIENVQSTVMIRSCMGKSSGGNSTSMRQQSNALYGIGVPSKVITVIVPLE